MAAISDLHTVKEDLEESDEETQNMNPHLFVHN